MPHISLRPRTLEHVKIFWEASQDAEIAQLIPLSRVSLDEAIAGYEACQKPDARSFGQVIYADGAYVGDVWCYAIDEDEEKQAFVSIVIFDKGHWGRGIGRQALAQFYALVFQRYRIGKLCAFTYRSNQRSIRALEGVGFGMVEEFEEEGVPSCYFELAAPPPSLSV